MPKVPLKPAAKFVKENWKVIATVAPVVGETAKKVFTIGKDFIEKIPDSGKTNYRKTKFINYKKEILPNLESKNRIQLHKYESEVKQFIKQINSEEEKGSNIKKPLHSKRINKWNEILVQLQDMIRLLDYQEYLRIYNDPVYESAYFKGFERNIVKIEEHINNQNQKELFHFINMQTNKSIDEIQRDFL